MNKFRTAILLMLASLLASLITFVSSGTAVAVESADVRWSAGVEQHSQFSYTDPKGGITLGCNPQGTDGSLRTYGPSGQLVRNIAVTPESDVCIWRSAVDKNGDTYGYSRDQGDLLAYSGNVLKWRYATSCHPSPTVGADGNIYAAAESGRLIALSPNAAAGQTQPEKVRDVPLDVPVDCGAEFTAFKDGLWTADQARMYYFYSYGGKKLAQFSPARRPIPTSINANGLMIYGTGDTVSAFDPMTNAKKWSINLSSLDHTVTIANVYATSDGGAIVQTNGTAPELIKLNAYGNVVKKAWSRVFPSVDDDGSEFGVIKVVPNGHGKAVLVRSAKLATSNPATKVPAIGIAVLDVVTGELSYNRMIKGNLDASSGDLYGYQLSGDEPRLGVDSVNVVATCVGVCSTTAPKLFSIKVPGMRLDYPRGAVLVANAPMQPSAVPYVAMGDSFSSGEGVEPFEESSNTDTNKCHRSEYAYPKVLSRNPKLAVDLGAGKFVACSGATTKHITGAWTADDAEPDKNLDEAPQVDALTDTTKVVSLTIGGNDAGFSKFGEECFWRTCDKSTAIYKETFDKIEGELPAKLETAYKAILEATKASGAKVYVLGYPQVIAEKSITSGLDARCLYMKDGDTNWGDARASREIVRLLNKAISDKVEDLRDVSHDFDLRLEYVPLDEASSSFEGHEICGSGVSWFQNADQGMSNRDYAFHPNKAGQDGLAGVLREAVMNIG